MTVYGDAQALRAALDRDVTPDFGLHEYATALISSVEELFEGTTAQRVAKLIADENGLPLPRPALHMLAAVLAAIDAEDELWGQKRLPDSPSVTDYAAAIISHLQHCYGTPGIRP